MTAWEGRGRGGIGPVVFSPPVASWRGGRRTLLVPDPLVTIRQRSLPA